MDQMSYISTYVYVIEENRNNDIRDMRQKSFYFQTRNFKTAIEKKSRLYHFLCLTAILFIFKFLFHEAKRQVFMWFCGFKANFD